MYSRTAWQIVKFNYNHDSIENHITIVNHTITVVAYVSACLCEIHVMHGYTNV